MIYLIGGAPRVGKTTLTQQISAKLGIGWVSTDLLVETLKAKDVIGPVNEWNAEPEAVKATAEWFFPCLERFIWGVCSLSESYVIEGVSFLPKHAAKLTNDFPVRSVFLGCSTMTLETFDRFPGHSKGYARLSEKARRNIVRDIPVWSGYIQREAESSGYPYIDTSDDFHSRLDEAEAILTA